MGERATMFEDKARQDRGEGREEVWLANGEHREFALFSTFARTRGCRYI